MAAIFQIVLDIQTANETDAGGDGPVYLGVCGREFNADLRSVSDDFEQGTTATYVFGRNHNIENNSNNDPRVHQLDTDNIDDFPVYIRLAHPTEHWKLYRAVMYCNGQVLPQWTTSRHFGGGIWLGRNTGTIVYLTKNSTDDILSDEEKQAISQAMGDES